MPKETLTAHAIDPDREIQDLILHACFAPLNPLTRREFLKALSITTLLITAAAIGLTSCTTPLELQPQFPATPVPNIDQFIPLTKPDKEFPTDTLQRTVLLIQGIFPESWKKMSLTEVLPHLHREILETILPEFLPVLSAKPIDIGSFKKNVYFLEKKVR